MWRSIGERSFGIAAALDHTFTDLQRTGAVELADLSDDTEVVITSDYAGHHASSRYEAYSFLLTTPRRCREWDRLRQQIRREYKLDRRVGYKNAHEKQRAAALPIFLTAAAMLEGFTVTVLVERRIRTLFSTSGKLDCERREFDNVVTWKTATVERLLRVVNIAGALIAGVLGDGQKVLWVTDEDDIVANAERLQIAGDSLVNVVRALAAGVVGEISITTTAADDGSLLLEDLAAIPDLAAGASVDLMTDLAIRGLRTSPHLKTLSKPLSRKHARLVGWLSVGDMPHAHIIIAIDRAADGRIGTRRMQFETMFRTPAFAGV